MTQMQLRGRLPSEPARRRTAVLRRDGRPTQRRGGQSRPELAHHQRDRSARCVTCVAFRPAVANRNHVGSARFRALWIRMLACNMAVPRCPIVRRCNPCRRPEIPSKLTQMPRPDQYGFPDRYLLEYSTKSSKITLVRKPCYVPTNVKKFQSNWSVVVRDIWSQIGRRSTLFTPVRQRGGRLGVGGGGVAIRGTGRGAVMTVG
jgi:hypothetical protein